MRAVPIAVAALLSPVAWAQEPPTRLGRDEIGQMPGTGGDPLLAVEALPGVTPAPTGLGPPAVLGLGAPELRYHLEGLELPHPFHLLGVRGAIDPAWVDRVEVLPGPPVPIGDAPAAIDVRLRAPARDRPHASGAADALHAAVRAEAPVKRAAASVGVSIRRSLLDLWGPTGAGDAAPAALADGGVHGPVVGPAASPTFADAPTSWDYLVVAAARPGERQDLHVLAHGLVDSVALRVDPPADADPVLAGTARRSFASHVGRVRWYAGAPAATTVELRALRSSDSLSIGSELHADIERVEGSARVEHRRDLDDVASVEGGLEIAARQFDLDATGPPPREERAPPPPAALGPRLSGHRVTDTIEPAAWIATPLRPTRGVRLVPAVRAEYQGLAEAVTIDPRVHLNAAAGADDVVRGRVGLWSLPPRPEHAMPSLGAVRFGAERVAEAALGFDHRVHPVVLSLDGWMHRTSGRAVAVPVDAPIGFEVRPQGSGAVEGAALSLSLPASGGRFARVAYSLSSSERTDGAGATHPFSGDRAHAVVAAGGIEVGDDWTLGARFRLASGVPVPRVEGAVRDADAEASRPILGASRRLPVFHQLDVRLAKTWRVGGGTIGAFVDVQNVYDARNVVGRACSFDFDTCVDVTGLPVLPTAGVEASW